MVPKSAIHVMSTRLEMTANAGVVIPRSADEVYSENVRNMIQKGKDQWTAE